MRISEAAERSGLTIHTLRYYDKEGLLPFVRREGGQRVFTQRDLEWLRLISCLRHTGMPIHEVRRYVELCVKGEDTLLERQAMILERKKLLEEQMRSLQCSMSLLSCKLAYYEQATRAGSEKAVEDHGCNPTYLDQKEAQ